MLSTAEEWEALINTDANNVGRTFFIDNLSFISSNPSSSSYAKEAGEGWYGANTQYPEFSWGENYQYDYLGASYQHTWQYAPFPDFVYDNGAPPPGQFGHGLAPRPTYPTNDQGAVSNQDSLINGIEGIITTNVALADGP